MSANKVRQQIRRLKRHKCRFPPLLNKEQVPFVRNTLEEMHAPVGES